MMRRSKPVVVAVNGLATDQKKVTGVRRLVCALLFSFAASQAAAAPGLPPTGQKTPAMQVERAQAALDPAALYAQRCAACHDHPRDRIPPRIVLSTFRTSEEIIEALTTGIMLQQAEGLTAAEIRALAVHLTGKKLAAAGPDPNANLCRDVGASAPAELRPGSGDWNGWGRDLANTRFHPVPGLEARDVPRLKLKWAFAYPGRAAFGQPVIVGGRLFGGGGAGRVFSLDARTGCTYWSYAAGTTVRTAVVVGRLPNGRFDVWFGDEKSILHAVDALTGELLWKLRLDEHPGARVFGTPAYHEGRLYVGVSSNEEVAAADPKYGCCTFRGSVVALDAASGRVLWKSYTVRESPRPTRINTAGTPMQGPAGGAVFSAPTIDAKRRLLYVGTGDGYTSEQSDSTDAVIALDLTTGERRWTTQVEKGDSYISGCDGRAVGNCPTPLGGDYDFSASPILATLERGRELIVAGAKSGVVYGLDPRARGRILWQQKIAPGSADGGILWGPAADAKNVYVATSQFSHVTGRGAGGLAALDIATGQVRWRMPAPELECAWGQERCSQAQVAAVTAIPGVVFSGALDGRLRAYSSRDGRVLWEFDTAQRFPAVNGGTARGGGIDFGGQTIAGGLLYVHSGSYRSRGSALLAFSVEGR